MIDDKIFSGKSNIVLFSADENEKPMMPIGNVIAHSAVYDEIPDTASCDYAIIDRNMLTALLFGGNAEEREFQLLIQSEVYIFRPKNLKHPNKKRARRIWKKWAKRYGTRGGESILIPKAIVEFDGQCANIIGQSIEEE